MDLGSDSAAKPDPETPSPFTNGVVLKSMVLSRHHLVVTYKECLKNHAAALGGHAVDGCGEFMPSPNSNPSEPTSLKCAACGCHRNFHRRDPDIPPQIETPALEYHPLNRHHAPRPPLPQQSPVNSQSPPPISSAYAPHMLLALSHGLSIGGAPPENRTPSNGGSRKRFRTKFTLFQKDKMLELAERVEWKMQKKDEDLINESCNQIGVDKGVFKVWMHNNKNTLGKKDPQNPMTTPAISVETIPNRPLGNQGQAAYVD